MYFYSLSIDNQNKTKKLSEIEFEIEYPEDLPKDVKIMFSKILKQKVCQIDRSID